MIARRLFAVSLFVCACGGPTRSPPPHPALSTPDAGAEAGAPTAPVLTTTLADLEARGPTDAPSMKKLAAIEIAHLAPSSEIVAKVDQCLRASFAASKAVRGSFVDDGGAARGEAANSTAGTVPPGGPMCMKKGERVRLVFQGFDDTVVRAVVFASP